jgi:hypothetical protein
MRGWTRWLAVCVGGPPALVAVMFGASGAAALIAGRPLIWPPEEITLAEAVGLRDQGEVVRQIMLGSDPNRRYQVRDVFRDDEQLELTPLEAAVITREVYMVDLVVDYGASIGDGNAAVLQCLARALGADEVRTFVIDRSREADCGGIQLPWKP